MSKDDNSGEEYKIYGFKTRIDKSKAAEIGRPFGSSTISLATSPYFPAAATTKTNQSPVIDQHSLPVSSLLEHEVGEYCYKLHRPDKKDQVLNKYAHLFGLKPVSCCRNANNSASNSNNIDGAESNSCNSPGKPFISTASPPPSPLPTGCNGHSADKTEAERRKGQSSANDIK